MRIGGVVLCCLVRLGIAWLLVLFDNLSTGRILHVRFKGAVTMSGDRFGLNGAGIAVGGGSEASKTYSRIGLQSVVLKSESTPISDSLTMHRVRGDHCAIDERA